jgi:hypothetical protein
MGDMENLPLRSTPRPRGCRDSTWAGAAANCIEHLNMQTARSTVDLVGDGPLVARPGSATEGSTRSMHEPMSRSSGRPRLADRITKSLEGVSGKLFEALSLTGGHLSAPAADTAGVWGKANTSMDLRTTSG